MSFESLRVRGPPVGCPERMHFPARSGVQGHASLVHRDDRDLLRPDPEQSVLRSHRQGVRRAARQRKDQVGQAGALPWERGLVGSLNALRRGSLLTVFLLFALLSLLLLAILAIADYALQANAFPGALAIVVGLAVLFIFFQWLISPAIVRWAIRGRRPITAEANPWVYRTVEETARQAGVPTPKIWESGDDSPNAFVFGRTISSAELVITQGLLERLNQDEIRAVLAHEIGHLRHRDVIIMTLMSAVPLIAYVIARLGFGALRGNVRVRGKGAGQAFIIINASPIVLLAVYLVAKILVLYLFPRPVNYADAYTGAATRDPHLLASALTKIAYGLSLARPDAEPSGLRAFMIGDPLKAEDDYRELQV